MLTNFGVYNSKMEVILINKTKFGTSSAPIFNKNVTKKGWKELYFQNKDMKI